MVDDPVVLLEGPRSVGKSTLLQAIAAERGARVLDLDDLATCDAVAADPATSWPSSFETVVYGKPLRPSPTSATAPAQDGRNTPEPG